MMIRHTQRALKGREDRDLIVILFVCLLHAARSLAGVAAPHEDDDRGTGVTVSP
jgi:hypothetical protein